VSLRAWLIGGAVLGAWWLLAPAKKTGGKSSRPAPKGVLLIGDSLAVGLQPIIGAYYRDQGIAFTGAGEGSTNARQWRARMREAVAVPGVERPDLVLVSLGTNDALSDTLRSEFSANMIDICESVGKVGARCLWLRAPNRTAGMVTAPVESLEPPPGVELQPDGIHPTTGGYASWASHVVGSA
jgi:lysophospholipase L1-like esterase